MTDDRTDTTGASDATDEFGGDGGSRSDTMEPCPMCAGAARLARVGRVVFGAWNDDYGAAGSVWDVLREGRLPVRVEVVGGVLERDCAQLVKSFFQDRRGGAGVIEGV